MKCPSCGRWNGLLRRYRVGEDGAVIPTLVCEYARCDFLGEVRLDGWLGVSET